MPHRRSDLVTPDGRPWIDVSRLLYGKDGRTPWLKERHLKAPHSLLGPLARRYRNGWKSRYAHPDAVAAYYAWRDAGGVMPKVKPYCDCGPGTY